MYTNSMILKMVKDLGKYIPSHNYIVVKLSYRNGDYNEFIYNSNMSHMSQWYTIGSYININDEVFKTIDVLNYDDCYEIHNFAHIPQII